MARIHIDTVTLELINGALRAARAEMEALIDRTSMSPFIREKKDYFTAFLDRSGNLVVSTSLTLAGNLVEAIMETYPLETMREGDLYWYNDAYGSRGGVSQKATVSEVSSASTLGAAGEPRLRKPAAAAAAFPASLPSERQYARANAPLVAPALYRAWGDSPGTKQLRPGSKLNRPRD